MLNYIFICNHTSISSRSSRGTSVRIRSFPWVAALLHGCNARSDLFRCSDRDCCRAAHTLFLIFRSECDLHSWQWHHQSTSILRFYRGSKPCRSYWGSRTYFWSAVSAFSRTKLWKGGRWFFVCFVMVGISQICHLDFLSVLNAPYTLLTPIELLWCHLIRPY